MAKPIDLSTFRAEQSEILVARRDILAVRLSDRENSRVVCDLTPDLSAGAKYLTFDMFVHNDETCCCLLFDFFENGNESEEPDFFFILGFLPKVRATVSLPLDALSGKRIFLDRIPGALKFLTHGKNVDIQNVARFAVRSRKSAFPQRIQISDMRFTEEPVSLMPESAALVDALGQWTGREWPDKVHSEEELVNTLRRTYEAETCISFGEGRSRFGGWTGKRFDATGFFRVQRDGGRWWLADPDGCAFFSAGLDCVRPDESYTNLAPVRTLLPPLPEQDGKFADAYDGADRFDFAIANLIRAFGKDWFASWSRITCSRMLRWGFNTVANWSDPRFYRNAKLPYVFNMKDFPKTEQLIFRDFPDVFSPEYAQNAERFAEQLKETAEDPYLIGYFLDNEPNWAWGERVNIAEDMLRSPEASASKDALIAFLSQRYAGDIAALNRAWGRDYADFDALRRPLPPQDRLTPGMDRDLMEFSGEMIRLYCEIPSAACRRADPNHLNLGLRYASIPNAEILAGCGAFDVFSMNCYKIDPSREIERAAAALDMPLMIGEYHFGALDAGMPATGLRAVTSQAERANAYRYYLQRAASMPCCVGVHYFTLNDQPALGRHDGENYQIGCVNVCGREYKTFAAGAAEAHRTMYEVAAGQARRYDLYPDETDWIAY